MERDSNISNKKIKFIFLITAGFFSLGYFVSPWLDGYASKLEGFIVHFYGHIKSVVFFLNSNKDIFSYEKINSFLVQKYLQLDGISLPVFNNSFLNEFFNLVNNHFEILVVVVIGAITLSLALRVFVKSAADFILRFPIKKMAFEFFRIPIYAAAALPLMIYYLFKGFSGAIAVLKRIAPFREPNFQKPSDVFESQNIFAASHRDANSKKVSDESFALGVMKSDANIKNEESPRFELSASANFEGEAAKAKQVKIKTPQDILEQHVIKIPEKVTFITKPSCKNSVNDLEQFVNLAKKFQDKNKKRLVIANFKGDSSRSFSKYLEGGIPFNQLIYSGFIENADLITHSSECFALKASEMKRFFNEAQQEYDEIIIFTPETERYGWDHFFKTPISQVEL